MVSFCFHPHPPGISRGTQSYTQPFFLLVPTMLLDELIVIHVKKQKQKQKTDGRDTLLQKQVNAGTSLA